MNVSDSHIGVIYSAIGERWVKEAVYSSKTLKKYNPQLLITLYTDKQYNNLNIFDNVEIIDKPVDPFKFKIWSMINSPYLKTLYIDTDTEIRGKIEEIFLFLDTNDIAISGMRWLDYSVKPPKLINYEKPNPATDRHVVYNTGIIAFKKSPLFIDFATLWYNKVEVGAKPGKGCDQVYFNNMLADNLDLKYNLKIVKIPNIIYNARVSFFNKLKKEGQYNNIKIVHEHGLNLPFFSKKLFFLKREVRDILQKYNIL